MRIIAVAALFLLSYCNSSEYTLNLLVNQKESAQISGDIICQDTIVGKLGDLSIINDSSTIVKMQINHSFKIPQGSEFRLISGDNFDNRTVDISLSHNHNFLSDGDTVIGIFVDINYPLQKHTLSPEDSTLIHNSIQVGIDSLGRFIQKK